MSEHVWIVWEQPPGTGPEPVTLPRMGAQGITLTPGVPSRKGAEFAKRIMEAHPNVRPAQPSDFLAAGMDLPAEYLPQNRAGAAQQPAGEASSLPSTDETLHTRGAVLAAPPKRKRK